jgi:hypothetical protein
MKECFRPLRWLAPAVGALLALGANDMFAQAQPRPQKTDFLIKRIELRRINPGSGGASGRGGTEAARVPWTLFECEFDSQPEWADDVEIKWYVLLGGGRQQVMATGSDTYIYVKKGHRHVGAMLMHPMIMERWAGSTAQANLESIGVEIWWQGRLVSFDDTKKTKRQWWQQFTPQPGLLMRVSESPWSYVFYADYEWSKYTTSKQNP